MYPTQLHSYLLWRSATDPDAPALAARRRTAAVSLLPVAMAGIFVFGWWACTLILLSLLFAFLTDFVCQRFIYQDAPATPDGTWLLTGLLLSFLIPPNAPWWLPVIGVVLAIWVGKYYWSVDGMPLFQPAALGLVVLQLAGLVAAVFSAGNPMLATRNGQLQWPVLSRGVEPASKSARALLRDFFGGDVRKSVTRPVYREKVFAGEAVYCDGAKSIPAEAVHGPRPLDLVKAAPAQPVGRMDGQVSNSAERYDTLEMILGYVPGTIGGSSALAIGFGVLLLIFSRATSWVLPGFALATMFGLLHALAWLYGPSPDARVIAENIPVHLLTGSTLLGVFYLAADPATAPRSFLGKVYAGIAFGVLEVCWRIFTPLTEGIFLSVIIVQALSVLIDQYLAPPREKTGTGSGAGLTVSSLSRL